MTVRTMKDVFGFELDRDAELKALTAQLDAAAVVVRRELVEPDVACRIYTAHVKEEHEHSCLGCNLNEAIHELETFLSAELPTVSPLTRLRLVLELVNTVWERIRDVCLALEFPKGLWCADDRKFAAFKDARGWANFMKHPGFFGLGIHHPLYVAADSPAATLAMQLDGKRTKNGAREWVLIDAQFVKANWSGDHTGEKAKAKLSKAFTACVVLPDVEELAKGLCNEFVDFVDRMQEPTWVELARQHALTKMPCDWWY